MEVIKERPLAISRGESDSNLCDFYYLYATKEPTKRLSSLERTALMAAKFATEALLEYKRMTHLESKTRWPSDSKAEEIQELIGNAVYTILEAQESYQSSDRCRLLVDKLTHSIGACNRRPKLMILAETKRRKKQTVDGE